MLDRLTQAPARVVGAKQVLRALREGRLQYVYYAMDADPFVTRPVIDAAEKANVPVLEADTMADLGKACKIDVGAAVAAATRSL